ncbi:MULTISPECIES: dUTP diphosphatase [Corynebacterium]|uniref:dUTP diphosphatase n=1 Tax=Corynebacterium TaxID=1716 RepID=UPI001EF66C9D|nr:MULTISPECIES: dUTP diphosphatase [Corynebacterium]MCG7244200.1 dUTP diphosphatase [Corynebacterium sp. ACRPS]MCG7270662.1 dUTP diphosphatase [Corynebacterium sp. ACRQM]MCG7232763.1 dUTP diphosphatase [Corynebacterium sp. ACRPR]MDK8660263.1 dUTP diphosphatase [Corynebacterium sp. MSK204]WKS60300.1 dUTP diphosphatase [Corynebacterium accolens]
MKLLFYSLDDGAAHPRQAYKDDAGIDLALKHDVSVPVGAHRVGDTGVKVAVPRGHVGMIFVRSSTGIKRKLVLSNGTGIIDSGFTGSIKISLHNTGDTTQHITAGDYIAQLVIIPIATNDIAEVRELPHTERGTNGIGSSN